MHPALTLLNHTDLPPLTRSAVEILQVNPGYRCNQSCEHRHANAGPNREEEMSKQTVDDVIDCCIFTILEQRGQGSR